MKEHPVWETAKTILVCILLVSLVCLSIVYMLLCQETSKADFSREDYLEIKNTTTLHSYSDYFDASLVLPAVMAIRADSLGDPLFITECAKDTAKSLTSYYLSFFSDDAFLGRMDSGDGRQLIPRILSDDYIYVKYQTELPKSVIYKLSESDRIGDEISDEGIYELLIFPVGSGYSVRAEDLPYTLPQNNSLCILAWDLSGNFFLYTDAKTSLNGKISFNTNFYNAYSSKGNTSSAVFFCNTSLADTLTPSILENEQIETVLLSKSGTISDLHFTSHSDFLTDKTTISLLFSAFGMNPEKVSVLNDIDGGITYYESNSSLKITADGHCSFSALSLDAAPSLMTTKSEPDTIEYIGATATFLHQLPGFSDILEQNDATLVLSEYTAIDDRIRVSFGFVCDNIPVLSNGKHIAVSFELYEGKITECTVWYASFEKTENVLSFPDNYWAVLSLAASGKERFDLRIAYDIAKQGTACAVWSKCFSVLTSEEASS